MAASRPMREDAGKGRQRSFKFERKLVEYDGMLCKKETVKTNQVSKAETKQAEKINKTKVKTQQNKLGAGLDVFNPCQREKKDVFPRQKCQSD